MILINDTLAPVLVAAIRDSFQRNSEIISRCEVGDVTSVEAFLANLGLLETEVRQQYVALEQKNSQLLPYEKLWPEKVKAAPPGETPHLTLVE